MLAPIVTILVVLGTLGIVCCNVFVTGLFLGSPPKGERAMGLVVVFAVFVVAGILLTLAGILASLRSDRPVTALLHVSPVVSAMITIAVSLGIAIVAVVAFTAWAEPNQGSAWLKAITPVLCWISGIIGPLLLAGVLLLDVWATPRQPLPVPALPARGAWLLLCVLATLGYASGGAAFGQLITAPLVRSVRGIAGKAREATRRPPPGVTLATELQSELDALPAGGSFADVVTYFSNKAVASDAACAAILTQRLLADPEADKHLEAAMRSRNLRCRWGAAEFVRVAPPEVFSTHQSAWATALEAGIRCTADDMDKTPMFLLDFDLKPSPENFVRSWIGAADRFRGTPHEKPLSDAMRTMASGAEYLRDDERKSAVAKVLRRAGYPMDTKK